MKAILSYPLYRRSKATNEEEATGYLAVGSVIEILKIEAGKILDGISIWFYADDGFNYWGGGIEFSDNAVFADWNGLDEEMQKALLNSLVADDLFWFQKKVIGYVGCGWGLKNNDRAYGLAVSLFVNSKTDTAVMAKTIRYKGFEVPIDIKEVNRFYHQLYVEHERATINPDSWDPRQMGGSISLQDQNGFGTRSMVLIDKKGEKYLMTCFHVLLNEHKSKGRYPFATAWEVLVETPSRNRNPFKKPLDNKLRVIAGQYNDVYDFALVSLPQGMSYSNTVLNKQVLEYYYIDELKSLVGKTVFMAGAKSYDQSGKVTDIEASLPVNDGHICKDIVVTEMMSMPGDSGAPVIDEHGKLVGIVVAGDKKERTLVLPVMYLFTQLGYKLYKQ